MPFRLVSSVSREILFVLSLDELGRSPTRTGIQTLEFVNASGGSRSRTLKPLPQLPLLLQDLELEPLHAVLERLLALAEGPSPQSRLCISSSAPASSPCPSCPRFSALWPLGLLIAVALKPALLELRPRLERVDPATLSLHVRIGTVEEQRDSRSYLIAQGRLGRC